MTSSEDRKASFWWLTVALCLYGLIGGTVSLLGWVLDIHRLADWDGNGITIQPNSAIAVIATSIALLALLHGSCRLAMYLGAFVLTLGATSLFQIIADINLPWLNTLLLFDREWGGVGTIAPGRMGTPGGTSWTLLGAALVVACISRPSFPREKERRRHSIAAALAFIVLVISGVSIAGYTYGAQILYTLPRFTTIAFQTATFIFALALGLLLQLKEAGVIRQLNDEGATGTSLRGSVPAVILLPLLLGWLQLVGEGLDLYDRAFGIAMASVVQIALLLWILFISARSGADNERRKVAIFESALDCIISMDQEGMVTEFNPAAEITFGYTRSSVVGRPLAELIIPLRYRDAHQRGLDHYLATGEGPVLNTRIEIEAIRSDGSEFPVELSITRVAIGSGSHFTAYVRDITERKNEEKRVALLARLGELTRTVDDVDELLAAIATAVGKAFGARRCLFNEIDLDSDTELVHSDYVDGVKSVKGEHRISAYSPITSKEMEAGRTVVNRDSKTDPRTAGHYDQTYSLSGERAYVAVPMMRAGRWVSSLWISTDEPRDWSDEDVRLLEGIAERSWLAIEKIRSASELEKSRAELEQRVTERTQQLMTTLDRLRIENEQRMQAETERVHLLDQLVGIQEQERRRIARDLHDELGQQLTALRLNLGNARDLAKGNSVAELIDTTQKLAENLDADIGFLAWELRPATLDHAGLSTTLSAYVREWSRFSGVTADFLVTGFGSTRLEPRVELNLYRIVQEALNNVTKYANATSVSVLLERNDRNVSLIIEDDGLGFDATTKAESVDAMGLIGMRERASIIGGSLLIESAPNRGTTIYIRLPFDPLVQLENSPTNAH